MMDEHYVDEYYEYSSSSFKSENLSEQNIFFYLECDLGLPSEPGPRLGRIAQQLVHLGGAVELWVHLNPERKSNKGITRISYEYCPLHCFLQARNVSVHELLFITYSILGTFS